ncbi:MAG: class I SAM-dependent methyltransferase [Paracoccaceae bacterium]
MPKDRKPTKPKAVQNRSKIKERKENIRRNLLGKIRSGGFCVEIGVWRGDFSETILEIVKPDHLVLIDTWEEPEQAEHSRALAARAGKASLDKTFQEVQARFSNQIRASQVSVIRDYSYNAIPKLDRNSVDFAYLDADHSYEGTLRDLELLMPCMKIGGVIACDDYHRRGWWKNGVIRAVNEHIGKHAKTTRILALEGAQVAFQKMEPMD